MVVGLPVSLDGSEGAQARGGARVPRPRWPRYWTCPWRPTTSGSTTRMADASAREGAGAAPDALAAAHLLEGYLATAREEGA